MSIGDDDARAVAKRLIGMNGNPDTAADVIAAFAQLAVSEHVDWLLGRTRHRSLSEMQIDRIAAIFGQVLPTEVPTATRLYNDLGLSHGQAIYVARVLADRQLSTWRERALKDLIKQIAAKLDKARENVGNDRGEAELQLHLTKLATRELEAAFEQAFRDDELINPPKRQSSIGDLNFVAVASATVVALAKTLGLTGD